MGGNTLLGSNTLMGGSNDMMAGMGGIDLSFAVSPHHESESDELLVNFNQFNNLLLEDNDDLDEGNNQVPYRHSLSYPLTRHLTYRYYPCAFLSPLIFFLSASPPPLTFPLSLPPLFLTFLSLPSPLSPSLSPAAEPAAALRLRRLFHHHHRRPLSTQPQQQQHHLRNRHLQQHPQPPQPPQPSKQQPHRIVSPSSRRLHQQQQRRLVSSAVPPRQPLCPIGPLPQRSHLQPRPSPLVGRHAGTGYIPHTSTYPHTLPLSPSHPFFLDPPPPPPVPPLTPSVLPPFP